MNRPAFRHYVDTRRIGDTTVSIVLDGSFRWAPDIQVPEAEWRRAIPEADDAGRIPIDVNLAHLRIGGSSIVIDLGFGDPAPSWPAGLERTPGMLAGLAALGVGPEDVTHVLITHAHGDHVEGATTERGGERVPVFPRARYLINRADWVDSPSRQRPDSVQAIHLGTLERLGRLDLVEGDHEVVPGVAMLHAPGESAGHSVVRIRSAGESFYFLGDLFHHTCEVEHLDWISRGRDRERARASRERVLAEAVSGRSTLVFSHRPFPGWGRVVRAGAGYRWEPA